MYDPLTSARITPNQAPSGAYWDSTAQHSTYTPLEGDTQTQVLIIGGGYTGLSCALELIDQGITDIIVCDANQVGWGCSTRNAGFVLPGSGRLSYQQLVSRYGMPETKSIHKSFLEGITRVESILQRAGENADRVEQGYFKLAHSDKWYKKLEASANYLAKHFDYEVETVSKQTFQSDYAMHHKMYGGMRYGNGFGLNPKKLHHAYLTLLAKSGVKIYSNSPIQNIATTVSGHLASTPTGVILANKVVFATNGYTPAGLPSPLQNKTLPVLSSVIVTRPLTDAELINSGIQTQQVMMDTRELKYYYRLLPDNRILFGGRGAITGKQANNPIYQNRLLKELKVSFSGLERLSIDYAWAGWVSVSLDQVPHFYRLPNDVYFGTGYCGSGVSFTSFVGQQLGSIIAGKQASDHPFYSDLPKMPFPSMRRIGQRLFYQVGRMKDALS